VQPEAAPRFTREARAAVRIKSEHVARVWDVGELDDGTPFMVMEYLEGRDLGAVARDVVLPIPEAIDYVIQACDALVEAHGHGIIHRDLKPSNLFLATRPDGMPLVKVLDFGISKMVGEGVDALTSTTAAVGSALYMSPEQMQQMKTVDVRTDIYALGITTFELLTGKQPFMAETLWQVCGAVLTGTPTPIRAIRPDVPDELASVLERAYARDRTNRMNSIADLVIALAPFAPPRSQPLIERILRVAGLPAAGTGAAEPSNASAAGDAERSGNTNVGLAHTARAAVPAKSATRIVTAAAVGAGLVAIGALLWRSAWQPSAVIQPADSQAAAPATVPLPPATEPPVAPSPPPSSSSPPTASTPPTSSAEVKKPAPAPRPKSPPPSARPPIDHETERAR
jgi:serine/threonine-protein kinase